MSRNLGFILLFTVSVILSGCGGSNTFTPPVGDPTAPVVLPFTNAAGGTLSHPATGHGLSVPPNGATGDTQATFSLLTQGLPAPPHPHFVSAGTAFRVDFGTESLITQSNVTVPYQTNNPSAHRLYWLLPTGIYLPLSTNYDPTNSAFSASLPQEVLNQVRAQATGTNTTHTSITVGLLDESSYLDRPAHQDWPSYNLYVFQNGSFQKFVQQGQTIGPVPELGDKPLMVVHGLGSDIPNFNTTAQGLSPVGFTSIVGFEYDTLSGIASTGPKLREAYTFLEGSTGRDWHHLAHSMGCVVSRQGIENGGSLPYNSNNVVLAAGPHEGSVVINDLQSSQSEFENFITALVVNNAMDFSNADGTPCKVSVTDQGFNDLAVGSSALQALNSGAAGKHPKETYRTLGGNDRGVLFDAVDALIGNYLDDGFVDLSSANTSVIGAVESQAVPDNHLNITTDADNGLRVILDFLQK